MLLRSDTEMKNVYQSLDLSSAQRELIDKALSKKASKSDWKKITKLYTEDIDEPTRRHLSALVAQYYQFDIKDMDSAINWLRKLEGAGGTVEAEAVMNIAACYGSKKMYKEAIKEYNKIGSLNVSEDIKTLAKKNIDDIKKEKDIALDIKIEEIKSIAKSGEVEKAMLLCDRITKENPGNKKAHYTKAHLHSMKKQPLSAMAEFRKAE